MIIPLSDKYLLISTTNSFILTGLVSEPFTLFIETCTSEYCLFLSRGDLISVSAPDGGDLRQAMILLELVKIWHAPLVALPAGHPGSSRLKMIVSAGDTITMNCTIQRGTHPEQTILCSSEELAGLTLRSGYQGVEVTSIPKCAEISLVSGDCTRIAWSPDMDYQIIPR